MAKKKQQEWMKHAGGIVLLIVVSLAVFSALESLEKKSLSSTAMFELTEDDIFSTTFNANDVAVFGLQVGDRLPEVVERLGEPDGKKEFAQGRETWEYGEALALDGTGLIVVFDNGVVISLTIREPFRPLLHGLTQEGWTKEAIYGEFGIPDKTIFLPADVNSALIVRLLKYETRGLDIIVRKENVVGFVLNLNDETFVSDGVHETETLQPGVNVVT